MRLLVLLLLHLLLMLLLLSLLLRCLLGLLLHALLQEVLLLLRRHALVDREARHTAGHVVRGVLLTAGCRRHAAGVGIALELILVGHW
jgi:hypothetical protein